MKKRTNLTCLLIFVSICCLALVLTGCRDNKAADANQGQNMEAAASQGSNASTPDSADALQTDKSSAAGNAQGQSGGQADNGSLQPQQSSDNTDAAKTQKFTLPGAIELKYSSYDLDTGYDAAKDTVLIFDGSNLQVSGEGVSVTDDKILISQAGTYILEGSLSDGQLIINAGDDDKVHLVLNGVSLYCSCLAPVSILNADKVVITTTDDSVNTVSDNYIYADNSANSCIYAQCDLTFNGTGTLNVTSNFNNGITSKDDIKIAGGTINVNAANNGIKGKDSVSIIGGRITVTSKDDGIKSDNEKKEGKGFIYLGGGTINISADDDCLQAARAVIIEKCSVFGRCYGNTINCDGQVTGAELVKEWM